jgi:hypothetical protein
MRKALIVMMLMLAALAGCADMQTNSRFKVGGDDVHIATDGDSVEAGVKNEDMDIDVKGTLPQAPESENE